MKNFLPYAAALLSVLLLTGCDRASTAHEYFTAFIMLCKPDTVSIIADTTGPILEFRATCERREEDRIK